MNGHTAFRLEKGTFHGFPSLTLRNEHLQATVVPALGGRMMAFGKPQGINCLYVFDGLERKKATVSSTSVMNAQELRTFRFSHPPFHYGGFKNWLSPETVWEGRPFLDLENADSQIAEDRIQVTVISPVCRETGMSFRRTFSLNRNGRSLEVEQRMFNHNNRTVSYGLWTVAQVTAPSEICYGILPEQSQYPSGWKNFYQPNSPLPGMVEVKAGYVKVICGLNDAPQKIGSDHAAGWVVSRHSSEKQVTYLLKTFPVFPANRLPHGCNLEIYLFHQLPCAEIEVLAPVRDLKPGESCGFTEQWYAFTEDEPVPIPDAIKIVR